MTRFLLRTKKRDDMRLGTLRTNSGTVAVRVDADSVTELPFRDVGEAVGQPDWRQIADSADGRSRPLREIEPTRWSPPVVAPGKIICVGLNYAQHIREMGRDLPEFPTLFPKYAEALVGPYDDISVPPHATEAVDWEGELAVIIGRPARFVDAETAAAHIAGFTILNDVTMRDYQYRTSQWMQGKTFESSTPVGPWMVTPDGMDPDATLETLVGDSVKQSAKTSDLVFSPRDLVAYISQIITLGPGDMIATGTPGGVGHARTPREYLTHGSVLETSISGIGRMRNRVVFTA